MSAAPLFRLAAKQFHLTYPTHVDFATLREFIVSKVGELQWYSIVHELGHAPSGADQGAPAPGENDANPTPEGYDHTHFAFACRNKFQSRNARIFDFNGLHPHIQPIKDHVHAQRLFHEYHRKQPIAIEQSSTGEEPSPVQLAADASTSKRIKAAPNLLAAAAMFGITPTTFTDIALIRNEKRRAEPPELLFQDAVWTLLPVPGFRCLYIWGEPGTGKTSWAIHQFKRPFFCNDVDDLKLFDPERFDGIVMDDCNFSKVDAEFVIALLDWDMDRSLRSRYTNAWIPAKTQKIICSNLHWRDLFPVYDERQKGAVARRLTRVIQVNGSVFLPPAAIPNLPLAVSPPIQLPLLEDIPVPIPGLAPGFNPSSPVRSLLADGLGGPSMYGTPGNLSDNFQTILNDRFEFDLDNFTITQEEEIYTQLTNSRMRK